MKYICRWGLMRNARAESLAEHSADTAMTAHLLAIIAVARFGKQVRPDTLAAAALYHDSSEIITGDMPTPVKYDNETLRAAYKQLENTASERLLATLPAAEAQEIKGVFTAAALSAEEKKLLKAADKLSALVKCIEEERCGNCEFVSAKNATVAALREMELPEVDVYVREFLPAFSLDLDELLRKG